MRWHGRRRVTCMRYMNTYIVGKPRVTGVMISPAARRELGLTEEELRRGGAQPVPARAQPAASGDLR